MQSTVNVKISATIFIIIAVIIIIIIIIIIIMMMINWILSVIFCCRSRCTV